MPVGLEIAGDPLNGGVGFRKQRMWSRHRHPWSAEVMFALDFRTPKIAAIVSEMVRSPQMMMRRLREGAEFFAFLRERRELAH